MLMPKDIAESHDFYLWRFSRGEGTGTVVGDGRDVMGKHADGSVFPLHLSVTHNKEKKTLTGMFKVLKTEKSTGGGMSTSMLNNLLQCVIIIDQRGSIEFINPAAEKLTGYRVADLIGRNVKMLMPSPYHDEHDGYLANYIRTGRAKVIGGSRDVACKTKDGSIIPVKLTLTEHGTAGSMKFTGILEPILDDARAKTKLDAEREILDSLVVPAVMISQTGHIQVFNKAACKIWGYTAGEVLSKNVRMLMGSPDREKHDRYLKRYLRTGESKVIGTGREVLIIHKDGSFVPVQLSVTEKVDAGKRIWTAIVQPM